MKEDRTIKLLLVDDDPNVRMMLSDFLLMQGYEVTPADSGETALKCMAEELPDLVLLDMGMPGMGGTGFLERITDKLGRTRVPVLVLTARSAMAGFFADKQIAGFLTKPADPDELLAEIQRIVFMVGDLPSSDGLIAPETATAKTLVLVESDQESTSPLRSALESLGFAVESVCTGAEALEAVIARHPDGLVMPLTTHVMSADEVLSVLRKMPAFEKLPAVIYCIDCGANQPEKLAAIAPEHVAFVHTREVKAVQNAVIKAIV